MTAEQALEVLDQYAPEKTSLLSGLAGKPLASGEEFAAVQENCRLIMEDVKQILEYSRRIGESRAAIAKLEAQIESLSPWLALDVSMQCSGTERTVLFYWSGRSADDD